MKPLRDWSGRRVVALALAWVIGLPLLAAPAVFGAVAWLARTERESATAVPDSVAPGLRVTYLPPESRDLLISVDSQAAMTLIGLLLIPPLALCVAWIVAKRRRSGQGS